MAIHLSLFIVIFPFLIIFLRKQNGNCALYNAAEKGHLLAVQALGKIGGADPKDNIGKVGK